MSGRRRWVWTRGRSGALRRLVVVGVLLCARQTNAAWPSDPLVNLPVCTATNAQLAPAIESDGAGGAFIVWHDQRAGVSATDVYANHVLANGTRDPAWPVNGLAVCTATAEQFNAKIVADGFGGAYVAWQDRRTGTLDIYVHHVLSSGQVDPAWPSNGLAVCTAANNQVLPEIVSDGAHGALLVWYDFRNGTHYDIYAHHVLPSGSVDPAWPLDGLAACTAVGDQRNAKVVPDGLGGAIVAWDDYRGGAQSDVYAQRVLSSGVVDPAWPADGSLLCGAPGNQFVPVLVEDGSGGALVAWYDYRGGATADIYATRVLGSGVVAAAWPESGRALCTAPDDQTSVAIVASGPGDAIVVWMDRRDGVNQKVYAQRATGPDGGIWAVNGVRVCSGAGDQKSPQLATDGYGGAIVTWVDTRSDLGNIYAQHVLVGGGIDTAWPLAGLGLCTASGFQQTPRILADGSGGAIVTWGDQRFSDSNIYAQRVQANGQLGGTVVGVPVEAGLNFVLDPVRPNPSRGEPIAIRFSVPIDSEVSLELLDVAGRSLVNHSLGVLGPGRYSVGLPSGTQIPAGLYFVRLQAGRESRSVRAVVLR